jgi:hypothetical protein
MRRRPISDVVGDLFAGIAGLASTEAELARAEVSENIDRAIRGVMMIVVGAVIVLPAAVIFLEGLALLLVRADLPDWLAYMVVGLVVAAIGAAVALAAKKQLKKVSLLPRKTIHQFRRDVEVAKQMRQDYERERAA